jgi:hypothetical protein
MEYIAKLAGALPKESDLNGLGLDELVEELWKAKTDGRHVSPVAVVTLIDVKEAKTDQDGNRVTQLRVRLAQPMNSDAARRATETALYEEVVSRLGTPLPHEVKRLTREAFADLPRTAEETDEIEERERDTMSPADEIRRHGERVHGWRDADLHSDDEARKAHEEDHDGDGDLPEALAHERDWIGWTRADLELAAASSDDGADAPTLFDQDGAVHVDEPPVPDPEQVSNVTAVDFSGGRE